MGGEKRVLITRAVEEVISETYTAEAAITLSHLAKLSKVSCHESVGGIFFKKFRTHFQFVRYQNREQNIYKNPWNLYCGSLKENTNIKTQLGRRNFGR